MGVRLNGLHCGVRFAMMFSSLVFRFRPKLCVRTRCRAVVLARVLLFVAVLHSMYQYAAAVWHATACDGALRQAA